MSQTPSSTESRNQTETIVGYNIQQKNLKGKISDLEFEELVPLRDEVEFDAVDGAWQRDAPNKQRHQHQVGKRRREVDHLQHKAQRVSR